MRRSRRHRKRRDSRPPLERRKQPRDDKHSGRKEKVDKGRPADVKGLELKGEVETGAMSSEVHRGQKRRDEQQKRQEKEKGKIQPSSRVESRGDSLEGQRRTRDPPPSSAARRRETTDVPIFAAGSRNVGQSGGAERSITLREGSPACSVSTAGVPQRPIAPVALAAEGYVDVEGVYVIPPYKHGRKQYMTASTELQLATEASARSCGVPSVQELTTLVFGLLNEEKDSTQRFVKVDACLKKINEVADDREKARLVALLFRRSNNALRHAHSKIMKRPDGKEVHDNGFPKLEVPGESEPHWLFVCPFVPHNPLMSTKREDLDMIDKLEQDDFLQKLDVTGLPDTIKRVLGFRDIEGESMWNWRAIRLLGLSLNESSWSLMRDLRAVTTASGTTFTQIKKMLTAVEKFPRAKLVAGYHAIGMPAMNSGDKTIPIPDLGTAHLMVQFLNSYFGLAKGVDSEDQEKIDDVRAKFIAQETLSQDELKLLSEIGVQSFLDDT